MSERKSNESGGFALKKKKKKEKQHKNDGTCDSLPGYMQSLPSSAPLGVTQLSLTLTHGNSHLCLL